MGLRRRNTPHPRGGQPSSSMSMRALRRSFSDRLSGSRSKGHKRTCSNPTFAEVEPSAATIYSHNNAFFKSFDSLTSPESSAKARDPSLAALLHDPPGLNALFDAFVHIDADGLGVLPANALPELLEGEHGDGIDNDRDVTFAEFVSLASTRMVSTLNVYKRRFETFDPKGHFIDMMQFNNALPDGGQDKTVQRAVGNDFGGKVSFKEYVVVATMPSYIRHAIEMTGKGGRQNASSALHSIFFGGDTNQPEADACRAGVSDPGGSSDHGAVSDRTTGSNETDRTNARTVREDAAVSERETTKMRMGSARFDEAEEEENIHQVVMAMLQDKAAKQDADTLALKLDSRTQTGEMGYSARSVSESGDDSESMGTGTLTPQPDLMAHDLKQAKVDALLDDAFRPRGVSDDQKDQVKDMISDEVESLMSEVVEVNSARGRVVVKLDLEAGNYGICGKQVYIRKVQGKFTVRVGTGWQELRDWLLWQVRKDPAMQIDDFFGQSGPEGGESRAVTIRDIVEGNDLVAYEPTWEPEPVRGQITLAPYTTVHLRIRSSRPKTQSVLRWKVNDLLMRERKGHPMMRTMSPVGLYTETVLGATVKEAEMDPAIADQILDGHQSVAELVRQAWDEAESGGLRL